MSAISTDRRGAHGQAGVLLWGVPGIVSLAAAYEIAIALGLVDLGSVSGAEPTAHGQLLTAGVVALLAAGALFAGWAVAWGRAAAPGSVAAPLLCLTAAAFMLGRFFSYDPYYLPTLRRMSDGGLLAGGLVLAVTVLSGVAALGTARRSRWGMAAAAAAMWLCAFCVWVAAGGH
jgi:hypothetical protein